MSTSLVRAALCSFITESHDRDLSERSKSASDSVRVFLDRLSDENAQQQLEFDALATNLVSTIENCVCTAISSAQTCRAKRATMASLSSIEDKGTSGCVEKVL